MPRRKLPIYVIAYIAGISAGYFYFEKGMRAEAAGYTISIIAAVLLLLGSKEQTSRFRNCILVFFAIGLLLFSLKYSSFETRCNTTLKTPENEIEGKVKSVSTKEDLLKITIASPKPVLVYLPDYQSSRTLIDHGITDGNEYQLIGKQITAKGEYKMPKDADNPGCFNNKIYLRSKGIALTYSADSIEIIPTNANIITKFRQKLYASRERFLSKFDEDTAGFLRGVVFGDKSEIDEDVIREFNINATGHILAISGLHVGFLYALLRVLSGKRRTASVSALIIAVIVIYGEMTLWSAATIRACIVLSLGIMAMHLRRRFDLLSSVSLAALLILTHQPYQLFNAGFQMSFLALTGIAFSFKPLSLYLGDALATMLSVQIGIVPICAYTFYRANLLSVFINIPIVLLSSFLVPLCIAALMLVFAFGAIPELAIKLIDLVAYGLIKINHILVFDEGFSIRVAGISAAAVLITYSLIFGLCSEWFRVKLIRQEKKSAVKTAAMLMLPVIMFAVCTFDKFSDDEIVFVSVGQGDCVHLRYADILIDGGGREEYNVGERVLAPYLLHAGTSKLDMAIATHLHMDHYKGICELSEVVPIGAIGIPTDYSESEQRFIFFTDNKSETKQRYSYFKDKKSETKMMYLGPKSETKMTYLDPKSETTMMYLGPKSEIKYNKGYIEVLWPVEKYDQSVSIDDANEHNSVYMIHCNTKEGELRIMVTGDLLEEDELKMLEHYDNDRLKCDILKIAHHGSKSSSSEAFLDATSPKIAVIQVGQNNLYGHPHKQTLDRLDERGIEVFRTDEDGAVGIDITSKGVAVDTMSRHHEITLSCVLENIMKLSATLMRFRQHPDHKRNTHAFSRAS